MESASTAMATQKPLLELELRRVEAPTRASPGACVYVLLPELDELVGRPGLGSANAIRLPGSAAAFEPWVLFAPYAGRRRLH